MIKIFWIIGLSILSGLLYYAGGQINKLFRRIGCPLCVLGVTYALFGWRSSFLWAFPLIFVLSYGAMSTYNDWIGYDCFWLTGLFYGLAAIPLLWCGVALWAIIGRVIFLALSIWWLRSKTGKVFKEEFFSGLLYCITIPLLLL